MERLGLEVGVGFWGLCLGLFYAAFTFSFFTWGSFSRVGLSLDTTLRTVGVEGGS
jgi:hypothetical protein